MQTELQGQLERVTFRNEENQFTIAKIKVKGQKDLVTIVGSLFSVSPGEILKLTGTWDRHPRFGEQFKFTAYETIIPATLHGIERYLGSGLIKGIGPVMAKRLVEKFGTETLDVIENHALRLTEVASLSTIDVLMLLALPLTARFSKLPPAALVMLTVKFSEPSASASSIVARLKLALEAPVGMVTLTTPVKSVPLAAVPL